VQLTGSQEYVVLTPPQVVTYMIRKREWDRIRADVANTIPKAAHWDAAAWGSAGVAGAGFFALLGLAASEKVPNAVWITAWSGMLIAAVLAVAFYLLHRRQRPEITVSANSICSYMDDIVAELAPEQPAQPAENGRRSASS
jgi:hypothetical protein